MTETPEAARPSDRDVAREPGSVAARAAGRSRGTSGDMIRSMLVVVAVVGVLLLIVPRPNKVPVQSIDVPGVATSVRGQLGFSPSVPRGLPGGWTAVAAEVQQATGNIPTWHLSYLTPSGHYAGVQEAAHPSQAWENRQVTDGAATQGHHQAAGRRWLVRSRTDRGITSWVLRTPDRTTIVTGTAGQAELDQLASALFA